MLFWNRSRDKETMEDSFESKQPHIFSENSNHNQKQVRLSQTQHFLGAIRDGGIWLS